MTRDETGRIMNILTTAYPQFYAGKNAPDPRRTVNLWAAMFVEEPVELVAAAVKALIASDVKGFPPHIGAVKEQIRRITAPEEMTEAEAWAAVKRALRNSTYGSKAEFARLPERLKRLVGSPEQLRDWAAMDAETVDSVVASNFQRSYKARAAEERQYALLPPDVRALTERLAGKLAIEGGTGDGSRDVAGA